jgi:hypothetical protein
MGEEAKKNAVGNRVWEMVMKEQQAVMNRKTRITTTNMQQQPQGRGNMRACDGMSSRCVTLGVAGSEDSPSPASAPGVPGTSSPLLACARHKRKRSKTGARAAIQQPMEQRNVSVFVARKRQLTFTTSLLEPETLWVRPPAAQLRKTTRSGAASARTPD